MAKNITGPGTYGPTTALVVNNQTFSGTIVVSGSITVGGLSIDSRSNLSAVDSGIVVSCNTFIGGITNSGVISAGGYGIYLAGSSTFSGNISNSGTIAGSDGIYIGAGVTFVGGVTLVNAGIISGTQLLPNGHAPPSSIAIMDQAQGPLTIDQVAGAIYGDIYLSAQANVLNIMGGGIGNIYGL